MARAVGGGLKYRLDTSELRANLLRLRKEASSATARNAVRRGLIEAAEPMVDRMRAYAGEGELAASIEAGPSLKNYLGRENYTQALKGVLDGGGSEDDAKEAGVKALRDARRAAKGSLPMARVFVGPTGRAGALAHFREFGVKPHFIKPGEGDKLTWFADGQRQVVSGGVLHPGVQPNPFARPAYEDTREQVLRNIVPMVGLQLQAAIQRAAKKKARKAAKARA